MLTQEQSVEIRVLSRQRMGIKPIARTLGVSRNTVRKYLRGKAEPARYLARAPRPVKLAPSRPICKRVSKR
jgi:transposase